MTRIFRRSLLGLYTPKITFMNYSTDIHIQIFKHVAVCIWPFCHLVPRLRIRGDTLLLPPYMPSSPGQGKRYLSYKQAPLFRTIVSICCLFIFGLLDNAVILYKLTLTGMVNID